MGCDIFNTVRSAVGYMELILHCEI